MCLAGLLVRLTGEETHWRFNYAWAPMTAEPQELPWIRLSTQTESYPHLQCHQLTQEYDLPLTVSSLDSDSNAVGLILCHTENHYNLPKEFLEGQSNWEFPLMLVTHETGQKLHSIISKNAGGAEVKVLLTSSEQTDEQQQGMCIACAVKNSKISLLVYNIGRRFEVLG